PPLLEQRLRRFHADVGAEQNLLDARQPRVALAGARPRVEHAPRQRAARLRQTKRPRAAPRLGRARLLCPGAPLLPAAERNRDQHPNRRSSAHRQQSNKQLVSLHTQYSPQRGTEVHSNHTVHVLVLGWPHLRLSEYEYVYEYGGSTNSCRL